MATVRIKLTTDALKRLQASTDAAVAFGAGSAPIRKTYRQWASRYSTFTRRRFNTYSRGGGNWRPLAESTILARRSSNRAYRTRREELDASFAKYGRIKGNSQQANKRRSKLFQRIKYLQSGQGVAILKDTGVLFNAITIGQQGNYTLDLRNGVRYGFAMGVPHGVTGASIGGIAGYHNAGSLNGRPPRRVILALPDQQTTTGMMMDLQRGIREIAKGGQ